MSVSGLCAVCSDRATATCDSCGATVCPEHYDATSGFCAECSRGLKFEA